MKSDDFFNSNHIDTLDKAKQAYILCGCNKYHMWHDYTDRLKEYEALNIPREIELEWMKEQFSIEIKTLKILHNEGKEWWYGYSNLVDKLSSLKDRTLFEEVISISEDIATESIDLNHYHMLSDIIGKNGAKTHGGLIEYAMKNSYKDIGQRAFYLSKEIFRKVRPIISEEQLKYLEWLSNNMQEILDVWPELDREHKLNYVHKIWNLFRK